MVYQSVDKILSLPNILYLGESLISWNTTSLHRSMLTAQWGVQGSHNAVSSPFTAVSLNLVFSWEPALWLANSQGRVRMRRMSQKSIDIFNSKQRLLSLDIKTKVVQHVPRIKLDNLTTWQLDNLTTWQLDNLTTWQSDNLTTWQLDNLTFLTIKSHCREM